MTIKISQLPNINIISSNTIIAVVDAVENTLTTLQANAVQLQTYINAPLTSNIANLQANSIAVSYSFANVWSNLGNVATSLSTLSSSIVATGIASNTYADSKSLASNTYAVSQAIAQANAANAAASADGVAGNTYAVSQAIAQANAANAYMISQTTAGNTYALSQATAANAYALSQAIAANAYALSQVVAANVAWQANALAQQSIINGLVIAQGGNYSNINLIAYLSGINTVTIGGNLRINGNLQVVGNVTEVSVVMTTEYANSIQAGNISAVVFGNVGAVFTGASLNVTGNVLASGLVGSSATINGLINTSANILAAGGVFNSLTVNGGISSTGFINTSGNVSGAVVLGGAVTTTGTLTAGFVNSVGNVLGAAATFNSLTVNGTTTLNGVEYGSSFINTSGNVSGSVVNAGSLNTTGTLTAAQINTSGNVLAQGGVFNSLAINGNVTGYLYNAVNSQQGIVQAQQYFALNSNLFVTSAGVGDVRLFGVNVYVASNTIYEFEAGFNLYRPAGQTTTLHGLQLNLGAGISSAGNIAGIATVTNALWQFMSTDTLGTVTNHTSSQSFGYQTNVGNVIITGTVSGTTAANVYVQAVGTITVGTGGWLSPRIAANVAAGGNYYTLAGSFFKITPLGPSGSNVSIGTWAV